MAKYKKRADGRYAKQVTVGMKGSKIIKKTLYASTITELEKKYRDLMYYVDRNVIQDSQGMTVSKMMEEWYRITKEGKIRRNTECSYSSIMKRIEVIGEMKVKDVKKYNVESLISDILKEGYENTAQSVLKMLRKIFDYAIESDIIIKNPCSGLSVKHKQKKKRVLTEKEKEILETADMTAKEKAFLYLLRYTGMRRGEIFALNKKDIDRDSMVIHVSNTIVDNNGFPFVQDLTKTDAGDRCIPIFLKLVKPLFEYMDTVDDYLFLNKKGKFMASNSMYTMFSNLVKKFDFDEGLMMHCFRHNFISECYDAKVDIKKVQLWVGHEDVSTTLNIYTKLSKQEIQDGDIMDDFYASQKQVKEKLRNNKTSQAL